MDTPWTGLMIRTRLGTGAGEAAGPVAVSHASARSILAPGSSPGVPWSS